MALTKTPIELSSTPSIVDGGNATAITIDSSENVLVGKTDTSIGVAGSRFISNGQVQATASGQEVLLLNRLSSDGELLNFRKDSATVGSIGVASGNNLTVGGSVASHAGLEFGTNRITPQVAGSTVDAVVDLGYSTQRFQDLFLSGGAYLGGTAAANKLDDFEEGTWTPLIIGDGGTTSGQSYGSVTAHYTKIGSFVFCSCDIQLTALGTIGGNYAIIEGLPFSVVANHMGGGSVGYYTNINNNSGILTFYSTQNQVYLMTGGAGYVSKNDLTNTTRIIATIVYKTGA